MDLEKSQVPSHDVAFFFVGKTTKSEVVNYDPWTRDIYKRPGGGSNFRFT